MVARHALSSVLKAQPTPFYEGPFSAILDTRVGALAKHHAQCLRS